MALLTIEFFEDAPIRTRDGALVYGNLISSAEDTSFNTTVEHVSIPKNALYCMVYSDTAAYIEIGVGNQDVTSSRRSTIPAGAFRDFAVDSGQTISYRSIA